MAAVEVKTLRAQLAYARQELIEARAELKLLTPTGMEMAV